MADQMIDPNPAQTVTPAPAATAPAAPATTPPPSEDWKTRYDELRQLNSSQGNELGQLRQEMDRLKSESARAAQPPPVNFDAQISELDNKARTEGMDMAEYVQRRSQIQEAKNQAMLAQIKDQAMREAVTEVGARLTQREFIQKNPDYVQLTQSGVLQQYMQANPDKLIRDEMDAYAWYKADMAMQEKDRIAQEAEGRVAAERQKAFEEGKNAHQQAMAGSEAAAMPAAGPGPAAQVVPPPKRVLSHREAVSKLTEKYGAK